jgi:hypothetical protein
VLFLSLFLYFPSLPFSLFLSPPLLQQFNVFWFGDLNYRVNKTREETVKLVAANDLGSLHAADQLALEMEAGRVFHGCVNQPLVSMDVDHWYRWYCVVPLWYCWY